MPNFLPKTLRGQLVLVILATFVVVQAISLLLFVDERRLAVRAALGIEAASRAANVVRLIEAAPAELRPAILRAANSPLVRFTVSSEPVVDHVDHALNSVITRRIEQFLAEEDNREFRVELHQIGSVMGKDEVPPEMRRMHRQMMGLELASVEMQLAIALNDGSWLNVATRFHRPPIQWPWVSTLSFALATLIVMTVVWAALSRLTGPLRMLARAAESLGRGEKVSTMPQNGPQELRQLTGAFNDMQARLTRFVSERTRLLAALGHDLRSPLTAMRVRTEMVEDDETRERLIAIIAEMQEMVESTLSFARGMVTSEQTQTVDLADFLQELTEEIQSVGGDVTLSAAKGITTRLKPVAMRRALRNVIENAIRYGEKAEITLSTNSNSAKIEITDIGPGIPEADQERVFESFVRLEKSRSMETGGTGLGLSIARTVVHAHGGEITLSNRAQGGLSALVTLPLTQEEE